MIENGKPIGVVLTMEEYELLRSKSQKEEKIKKEEIKSEAEKLLIPEIDTETNLPSQIPSYQGGDTGEVVTHPVGAAIVKEFDFSGASAELADINLADDISDVTLEDLGLDELPY